MAKNIIRTCSICGKTFTRWLRTSHICSVKCRGILTSRREQYTNWEPRFWSKVNKTPGQGPNGDCWNWTGGIRNKNAPDQRGQFYIRQKRRLAYQVAYELTYGDRKGLYVCHKCNNSLCVRPDHLYLGTHLDNMETARTRAITKFPRRVESSCANHADPGNIKLSDDGAAITLRLSPPFSAWLSGR